MSWLCDATWTAECRARSRAASHCTGQHLLTQLQFASQCYAVWPSEQAEARALECWQAFAMR